MGDEIDKITIGEESYIDDELNSVFNDELSNFASWFIQNEAKMILTTRISDSSIVGCITYF
jgi:hypothetical protein